MPKENKPNFIECNDVLLANKVPLEEYIFVGLRQDNYVFKIRERIKK